MKRFLLWSFERGSAQYDVICVIILAFIFITPASFFNDQPDFMRLATDQVVRQTKDDRGNTVYTVRVQGASFSPAGTPEAAIERLRDAMGGTFVVARTEPIYDTTGALVAYAVWIAK